MTAKTKNNLIWHEKYCYRTNTKSGRYKKEKPITIKTL